MTLRNDATAVAVTHVTDGEGRYIFDFVEPGIYTILAELPGFKQAEQRNVRVQQRDDLNVDLHDVGRRHRGAGRRRSRALVGAVPQQQLGHHARAAS